MPVIDPKNMLSEVAVRETMRRIAVSIPAETSMEQAIRWAIKNKINAILTTDEKLEPLGVVSKTDLMGAYYAGFPIQLPVRLIMHSPPLYCSVNDTLERALSIMRENRIHRLYVRNKPPDKEIGVIAYPDIIGLLYRYCHKCERNLRRLKLSTDVAPTDVASTDLLKVREIMTSAVRTMDEDESLMRVMEGLSAHKFGALLITGRHGRPTGVISKSDLILAYKHGVPVSESAKAVMRTPVRSCCQEEELAQAIRKMIFCDIQRFFVYRENPDDIVGVLTLSDAAQARSGSCRACMSSRIEVLWRRRRAVNTMFRRDGRFSE
jgi:CBS domain-containing protein